MNRHSTIIGLTAAIALSAGGVLVEHPLYSDPAPGAYSDIIIAEADNKKVPPESADKAPTSSPSTTTSDSSKGEDVSVDRDPAPRIPKVDKP